MAAVARRSGSRLDPSRGKGRCRSDLSRGKGRKCVRGNGEGEGCGHRKEMEIDRELLSLRSTVNSASRFLRPHAHGVDGVRDITGRTVFQIPSGPSVPASRLIGFLRSRSASPDSLSLSLPLSMNAARALLAGSSLPTGPAPLPQACCCTGHGVTGKARRGGEQNEAARRNTRLRWSVLRREL